MPAALKINAGARFGRLAVVAEEDRLRLSRREVVRRFRLQCECGGAVVAKLRDLRSGTVRSCGCLRAERIAAIGFSKKVHGESDARTPEYNSWRMMRERCLNQNKDSFDRYGGRGISVCREWAESFPAFLADMGRKPSSKHTLDRKNPNGNYNPGNCRWATPKEQANNRRNSRRMMEV